MIEYCEMYKLWTFAPIGLTWGEELFRRNGPANNILWIEYANAFSRTHAWPFTEGNVRDKADILHSMKTNVAYSLIRRCIETIEKLIFFIIFFTYNIVLK